MAKAKSKKGAKATKVKTKPKAKVVAKAKAKPKLKAKAKPKAKPKAAPKKPAPQVEQADLMRLDGMKVPSKKERAADVTASGSSPNYAKVRETVIEMFRGFYPSNPPESEEQILATDPNSFDLDPAPFYEQVGERFGLDDDPNNDYFGGFGGKIETTIANVAKRWDGRLRA